MASRAKNSFQVYFLSQRYGDACDDVKWFVEFQNTVFILLYPKYMVRLKTNQ